MVGSARKNLKSDESCTSNHLKSEIRNRRLDCRSFGLVTVTLLRDFTNPIPSNTCVSGDQ
jgi:hypothetical protein